MNNEAVQDWLRIRRELLDREAEFTDLAINVANGQGPVEDLQEKRLLLEGLRELCTAAYQRAFPSRPVDAA